MKIAKTGKIQDFCQPNALLTLQEYVQVIKVKCRLPRRCPCPSIDPNSTRSWTCTTVSSCNFAYVYTHTGLREPRDARRRRASDRAGVAADEPARAAGLRAQAQADPGGEAGPVLLRPLFVARKEGVGISDSVVKRKGLEQWSEGEGEKVGRKRGGTCSSETGD
jgi:hypothetical protein